MQLLITLRFYATSSFQIVNGDLRGFSQATVSRIIARVSRIIASHLSILIFLPKKNTHIRIANPGRNYGEVFRNRKGWFSLKVQVYFFKCFFGRISFVYSSDCTHHSYQLVPSNFSLFCQ
ncbi:hypothetical protein ALC57_04108 [Trachymyrmex cornetzi]|uniref:Nuclease HARBI1 n=1 Tax=Trachymyrmex cornetzi TaxID=471704 RepID=A0A151JCJ0_9HYME|nr:hypothetical protein ALC57_04108 [Trachymyrmex cornetzi]